ncbi:MAG: response regulator [Nitrospira sp.]|nr:response regulator [Nitrospira sp.]
MGLEIIEIVEDDQGQAKLLDQILRQASFRTNVAFDGPSAMQDVWRIKPSLIMADDNLPGLTGREMCKRLRQDPSTKYIPIILLSGYSSEERRVEALDGGADDFIVKPMQRPNSWLARGRCCADLSRDKDRKRILVRILP